MSDAAPKKPNGEQLDEELVAYLDGELESQDSQRLENQLSADPRARQRLNQLAVSWDLLDQLPRASVDDVFTRTTVEMLAVAAESDIAETSAAAPSQQRRRWLAGGVVTLLAAAVGFFCFGVALPDRNDSLLRNLPVVANLELYRSVGDVELLKKLESANLFPASEAAEASSKPAASTSKGNSTAAAVPAVSPMNAPVSFEQRRSWVAKLPADQKLELNRNLEKFVALSPEEKQSLRNIDDYLQANPQQSAQLVLLMQRYHDWLKTLSPPQRGDLADTSTPDQHVAQIKKLKQDQDLRIFSRLGGAGGNRDADHIARWMQDFAHQHEKEILNQLPDDRQQELQKTDDRGSRWQYPRRLAWELFKPTSQIKMPELTDADVKSLSDQLSSNKKAELQAATTTDERIQLLRQWMRAAIAERAQMAWQGGGRGGFGMNPDRGRRMMSDDDLKRFDENMKRFEDTLSADEKKRLDDLPPEQKRAELRKLYFEHRPNGRPQGFGRPGDDGPHDGPPPTENPGGRENSPPEKQPNDEPPAPPANAS